MKSFLSMQLIFILFLPMVSYASWLWNDDDCGNNRFIQHLNRKLNKDIDPIDKHGNSPLHWAIIDAAVETNQEDFEEKFECVKNLIESDTDTDDNNKMNVNAKNTLGNTALHLAVKYKNPEIAEFLINSGAFINARNNHNHTPLSLASSAFLDMEIVELLKKHGAK